MENRWNQLTTALISSSSTREKWWDRISQTLSSKGGRRHYYNLENLEKRFMLFDEYVHRFNNPTAVALAMFLQQLVPNSLLFTTNVHFVFRCCITFKPHL